MKENVEAPAHGDRLNVFLLNQSESMAVHVEEFGTSMADAVASSVNLYLQKLDQLRKLMPIGFTGDHFAVVVVGYGPEAAKVLLRIDPTRTEADEERTRSDKSGISSDSEQMNFPVWVKPVANGRATLCHALASAHDLISPWVKRHQGANPPNVINITDGSVSDGDPREVAERIMELSTLNGNATIWHCCLASSKSEPVFFPTEEVYSTFPDAWKLFVESSSVLPQEAIPDLLLQFPEVSKVAGARCCIFNADLAMLVRAIAAITHLPLP